MDTGWRLRIRHRSGYTYGGDVLSSFNEARMTPLTDADQTALDSRFTVAPTTLLYRYRDYWGTEVVSFDIQRRHAELVVDSTSVVETHPQSPDPSLVGWDELRTESATDRFAEWLGHTDRTDPDGDLSALARSVAGDLPPSKAAVACVDAVFAEMEYVPGSTAVHTNGLEAWHSRKGVCQDFAHISLAMLRSLGIPARYVSGYLHPKPSAAIGETVQGESHAWVQWWDGQWTGYDPTNGKPVGVGHVTVARARDYDDVSPLRGTFSGAMSSELNVSVEVTRLA